MTTNYGAGNKRNDGEWGNVVAKGEIEITKNSSETIVVGDYDEHAAYDVHVYSDDIDVIQHNRATGFFLKASQSSGDMELTINNNDEYSDNIFYYKVWKKHIK